MQGIPAVWPTLDAGAQQIPGTFDFSGQLDEGVTIVSVVALTCTDENNVDPSPANRLLGRPSIIDSPLTGLPGAAVIQTIGNGVAGANYLIQCVVSTSAAGAQPSLWVNLPCAAPG